MKRKLPKVSAPVKSKFTTSAPVEALERWNPGVTAAEEKDNTISILDVIGQDFFGEGVTAKRIAAALRRIGDQPVVVNINSPGGDFFEGLAIYNLLREHPHDVTVNVLGLAASAASVVAMAADELKIARAGFLMIHNAYVVAIGNRNELRDIADWLEPFDGAQADVLSTRSGIDKKKIMDMLDKETWLSGQQAVDQGFADDLLTSDQTKESPKAEFQYEVTLRGIDAVLARAGMNRNDRKKLLSGLNVTPGADENGTQRAAVKVMDNLLSTLKSVN